MQRSDDQSFMHIADHFQTLSDNDQMQFFFFFLELRSMKIYRLMAKHTDVAFPSGLHHSCER